MTTHPLKYLIAGTGGVGGSIAAFLALAGKDVTCIARGEHLAAIRENGLQLHSDLNDINEDTRIQLELINRTLAEMQSSKRQSDKPRNKIGFK